MKHYKAFFIFFFLSPSFILAQTDYKFQPGIPYSVTLKTIQPVKIIATDETGIFVEARNLDKMNHIYIEHYDYNLKRTLSKRFEFLPDKVERRFEYLFYSNNKILN